PVPSVLATAPSRAPEIPQRHDADESVPADPRLRDVAHWKGLPSGVQRQLRELGINAHVYSSDASARFIRAGGRTLREGDRLNAELRLQFITRDGIVLGYQERKYWMRLN
ncbi:general secretion pathway protein GspB, partial [Pseudomonas sp. EGD-AK9]|uniref:general secretion pathway protein GspB n=1 Tax=Pseudomonas sp. EGD-AK9 TaxID=1386078 RepID=UPI0004CDE35D